MQYNTFDNDTNNAFYTAFRLQVIYNTENGKTYAYADSDGIYADV